MNCRACMSTYLKDLVTILLASYIMTIILHTYLMILDSPNVVRVPDLICIVHYGQHQLMWSQNVDPEFYSPLSELCLFNHKHCLNCYHSSKCIVSVIALTSSARLSSNLPIQICTLTYTNSQHLFSTMQ